MGIAAVPGRAAARDLLRRVLGREWRAVGPVLKGDVHGVAKSLLGNLIRAEDNVPRAFSDGTRQVARRRIAPDADTEFCPETA
ncbi:hypothetical protein GCM10023063_13760 [Arthrobacter methylotrophus]